MSLRCKEPRYTRANDVYANDGVGAACWSESHRISTNAQSTNGKEANHRRLQGYRYAEKELLLWQGDTWLAYAGLCFFVNMIRLNDFRRIFIATTAQYYGIIK